MSRSTASPSSRRDSYHHGDLRRALLDAGRELLAQRGVDGLSLREVARRANVSQAAPYHHFADKAELISAIVQRGFEDFSAALRAGMDRAGESALQRLTGMGLAYVQFAVANPNLFRLLFRPELRGGREGPAAEPMEDAGQAAYRLFLDTVKAAVDEGSVQGSVEDVGVATWSAVHGLATLLVDGPVDIGQRSADKLARVVLYALGTGIVQPAQPAQPQPG